jgi:hypothetical protein
MSEPECNQAASASALQSPFERVPLGLDALGWNSDGEEQQKAEIESQNLRPETIT